MKLYLSGPMTGLPEYNFPAFEQARSQLRNMGHEVICPAEAGKVEGWQWEQYMRRDIVMLMDAEAVVVLPGWENSRGATLEVDVASKIGMAIYDLNLEAI